MVSQDIVISKDLIKYKKLNTEIVKQKVTNLE